MTVHDSVEADVQDVGTLTAYQALLNEQRLPIRVPLLWDVKTGDTWAGCAT